jgi:hypothetical protein
MASELSEAIVDAAERLHKREENPTIAATMVYDMTGDYKTGLIFKSYASEGVPGEKLTFYDYFDAISYATNKGFQLMQDKSTLNLIKIGNNVQRNLGRPE